MTFTSQIIVVVLGRRTKNSTGGSQNEHLLLLNSTIPTVTHKCTNCKLIFIWFEISPSLRFIVYLYFFFLFVLFVADLM